MRYSICHVSSRGNLQHFSRISGTAETDTCGVVVLEKTGILDFKPGIVIGIQPVTLWYISNWSLLHACTTMTV